MSGFRGVQIPLGTRPDCDLPVKREEVIAMDQGRSGMGSHKHGTSGRSPKSPRLKHAMKREAESQVRVDRTRIIDPKSSVEELFHAKAQFQCWHELRRWSLLLALGGRS